jgi:hypothetical protein
MFKLLAQLGIGASICTLFGLCWSLTFFLAQIQQFRHETELNAVKYRAMQPFALYKITFFQFSLSLISSGPDCTPSN